MISSVSHIQSSLVFVHFVLNHHEFTLLSKELSVVEFTALYGLQVCVITRDDSGASVYFDGEVLEVPLERPVNVVDSVGAGDTFLGYLINPKQSRYFCAELQRRSSVTLERCVNAVAAGYTCEKVGVLSAIPHRADF